MYVYNQKRFVATIPSDSDGEEKKVSRKGRKNVQLLQRPVAASKPAKEASSLAKDLDKVRPIQILRRPVASKPAKEASSLAKELDKVRPIQILRRPVASKPAKEASSLAKDLDKVRPIQIRRRPVASKPAKEASSLAKELDDVRPIQIQRRPTASKEEQIASPHQSLHSQREREEKRLQEQNEEVINLLKHFFAAKEKQLVKANRQATNYRAIVLYELHDTNEVLETIQAQHLSCLETNRLLKEASEHHQEEASKTEKRFTEMLLQREEALKRELAEQRALMEKELLDGRREAEKMEELHSLKEDDALPKLPKKKSRWMKRFWNFLLPCRREKTSKPLV